MPTKAEIVASKLEERSTLVAELDATIVTSVTENRDATPEETTRGEEIRSQVAALDSTIETLYGDIEADRRAAEVRKNLGDAAGEARTTSNAAVTDPEMYPKNGERSYFKDLLKVSLYHDRDAEDRLRRNDRAVFDHRAKQGRSITTVAGAGGEFVPPIWQEADWIGVPRPGRPAANLFPSEPLPAGTNSINLPKIATGTSTALVTSQNSALSNTDITSTSVTAAVQTVGGIQVMSVQLLEQSPVNMDAVLFRDLQASLDVQVDTLVLNSSTTNALGLLQQSSTTTKSFTSGSPVVAGSGSLYSVLNSTIAAIYAARYQNPTHVLMHPRRWQWILDAYDGNNRPLVVPNNQGPFNTVGSTDGIAYQGVAGSILGLPVVLDASIPTNTGTGTNQDSVVIVTAPDLLLYESTPKAEIFRETKADQGSVLVRLYEYLAFFTGRLPAGVGVITGTGLVTPTY